MQNVLSDDIVQALAPVAHTVSNLFTCKRATGCSPVPAAVKRVQMPFSYTLA
ncbi:hypothetical protein ACTHQ8_01680 [Lysinibacillus odysseyi]|uniref:hypothetical protein n=1 Tax=Lysinibacillus odysseyi TaxID=202611 RepID=UPI000AAA20F2|nr:hypothetical protein [Lysinibacillus odysseyi]